MNRMLSDAAGRISGASIVPRPTEDVAIDEVVLVDSSDRSVGTSGKLEAHRLGLRHRAVSVIVRDREGQFLLQLRADRKYHSGGLWTNTCCSHPRPGEPAIDAAVRRLAEEMGFSCPLKFLFVTHYRAAMSNGLIEDEIVHVFGGQFNGLPNPNPLEVQAWQWKTVSEIALDVTERPENYTVWFRFFCREYWREIIR